MPFDVTVYRGERIRLDGDIAVRAARRAVRIDMRVVEVDLTATDGVVLPVSIDPTRDVDATRAAVDRLVDVHAERHIDLAALP